MAETVNTQVVEAEIAQLSREIEAKRHLLEASRGIVEEKELIRATVSEKFSPPAPLPTSPSPLPPREFPASAIEKSSHVS